MNYNLRLFFGELLAFNYESYVRMGLDSNLNFRQRESMDILLKGNKWFIDNKHSLDKILNAYGKVMDLLRDCIFSWEQSIKYEMIISGIRRIGEWADKSNNTNGIKEGG